MATEIILLILEIVGTVAFAVSGAFVAIKAKLDIFGVIFIGCITAVGGGITRDLLIGATPPAVFSNAYILLVAALTSAAVFGIAYLYRDKFDDVRAHVEHVNNFFDAIGLAAFSVMGTEIAFAKGLSDNFILSVALGMLTGVGGGMIRDVLTSTTPYIFKKHVYALASIAGASLYYILRYFLPEMTMIATMVAMSLVFILRMLATKFRWELPKIQLKEEAKPIRAVEEHEDKKAS